MTSRSPAVLVTFATPSLGGARGATSPYQPGSKRTGTRNRGARWGAGAVVGGARARAGTQERSARGARPRPPREPERHARRHHPRWPEKPAENETCATHEAGRETDANEHNARVKDNTAQGKVGHRGPQRGEGPRAQGRDKEPGSRVARRAARDQHARICLALRFQISRVMLECSLWKATSTETKLRLHALDSLRERKTVNVPRGRPQALQTIGV